MDALPCPDRRAGCRGAEQQATQMTTFWITKHLFLYGALSAHAQAVMTVLPKRVIKQTSRPCAETSRLADLGGRADRRRTRRPQQNKTLVTRQLQESWVVSAGPRTFLASAAGGGEMTAHVRGRAADIVRLLGCQLWTSRERVCWAGLGDGLFN